MSCRIAIRCALAFVTSLLLSASANAQLFRAYLAPTGNDANPCTLPAPCRLLPAALAAVADGGEIWMLDSANYNTATVTINKSVSILAVPGAVGSIVATGGPAISIPAVALKVALRNVVIVPLPGGSGTFGISVTGGSTLTIEDSLIANLSLAGVNVVGTGIVKITNTTFRDNGNYAVWAQDGATVSVSATKMLGNAANLLAYSTTASTTTVIVSDSIMSGGSYGSYAASSAVAGAIAVLSVTRCTIEESVEALRSIATSPGSASVTVGSSMITNNTYGWSQGGNGSVIESYGNNQMRGNSFNVGVLSSVLLQ